MAKRYKKNTKNKKPLLLVIVVIIIIIATCLIIYSIKKSNILSDTFKEVEEHNNLDKTTDVFISNEEKGLNLENENLTDGADVNNLNISLSADVFILKDLNNDVLSKLSEQLENAELLKVQYQLKDLENGNIYLYYKLEEKLMEVKVDIKEKNILTITEYKDDELIDKNQIDENLSENIVNDFEENKELINEGKMLNIIITDTEVIMNTSYII